MLTVISCHGLAEGQSGPALLAACAARHWLARNAATVTRFCRIHTEMRSALACTSLVSCLPALEAAELCLPRSLTSGDLSCLLEGLAWCPRLAALSLRIPGYAGDDARQALPSMAALTKLRSLTRLGLSFGIYTFASVMDTVVFLTGLTELTVDTRQPAVVPAALGQLEGLQALRLCGLKPCVLEAGCLDLPNLLRLEVVACSFEDASVLLGITALEGLTHIKFSGCQVLPFFPQLLQLTRLEHLAFDTHAPRYPVPALANVRCLNLAHLDLLGHGLPHFPTAVTQLVALEYLDARGNEMRGCRPPSRPSQG